MSALGAAVALLLWGQLFAVGTGNNNTDNADDSCPKPPEIANGYVEHSVRYQCKTYYRLRTDGDGVYTLNSEKQWKNQAIGEKLPECEAGSPGTTCHHLGKLLLLSKPHGAVGADFLE